MPEKQAIAVEQEPLTVTVVGDEVVVSGFITPAPSLSAEAARETATQLLEAADKLDAA